MKISGITKLNSKINIYYTFAKESGKIVCELLKRHKLKSKLSNESSIYKLFSFLISISLGIFKLFLVDYSRLLILIYLCLCVVSEWDEKRFEINFPVKWNTHRARIFACFVEFRPVSFFGHFICTNSKLRNVNRVYIWRICFERRCLDAIDRNECTAIQHQASSIILFISLERRIILRIAHMNSFCRQHVAMLMGNSLQDIQAIEFFY